jgi:sugar/nucleoside kinase (ribokinase family)
MVDAILAGHLCVDIIPQIADAATAASDSFLAPGRLTEVGGALLSPGGCVSNTGLALRKLGLDVRLVARIGDDGIGRLTRDVLAARDPVLTSGLATAHGEPSSYTIVISPPGIDRTFLHCPGTNNTFGPEDIAPDLLRQTRLFHFGYPPLMRRMYASGGAELQAVLQLARAHGATTSLDMAMPDPTRPSGQADWVAILGRALPNVDIFLPSVEELLYMLQRERFEALQGAARQSPMVDALTPDDIVALGAQAMRLGASVLVLKLGHRGVYVRTATDVSSLARGRAAPHDIAAWAGRELWAPCFRVQVVSTAGSGDATISGFLAGLLRGQSLEAATTSAVAVGACNVEAADTTSGIRPWDETQARIARGWPRLDAHLEAPGWDWDERVALWHGPGDR